MAWDFDSMKFYSADYIEIVLGMAICVWVLGDRDGVG